jgi:hypothetical protein
MTLDNKRHLTRAGSLAVVVALLLAACGGDAAEDATTTTTSAPATTVAAPLVADGIGGGTVTLPSGEEVRILPVVVPAVQTGPDLYLVQDASVELRVAEDTFHNSWDELRRTASELGGYVSSSSTGTVSVDGRRYDRGTATLRVPADRFDEALDRVNGLGERIGQQVSAVDVTDDYLDLTAVVEQWRIIEDEAIALVDRASTNSARLEAQQRLDEVRLNLAQLETRKRHLESATSLSTVTVMITEAPEGAPVAADPGPFRDALSRAGSILVGFASLMIVAAAVIVPLIAVVALVYVGWRRSRRFIAPQVTRYETEV